MIRKILVVFGLVFALSSACFGARSIHIKDDSILRGFDVDEEFLQNFIQANANGENTYKLSNFLQIFKKGKNVVPILRNTIEENGLPEIILYLVMAESHFSPSAVSKTKAKGLWQFMLETGKTFKLNSNKYIDERLDILKSSKAAVKYLKYLHKMFGKWYLVAMAYNCGETRLKRVIEEVGSDDLQTLLDEDKKYIPKQTRRYISKILSMAALASSEEFEKSGGNKYLHVNQKKKLFPVKVPSATSLLSVANSIGIGVEKLKRLNPQLNYYFTPPHKNKYNIYIPHSKKDKFKKNFKPQNRYTGFYVYSVKSGDALSTIAKRFGIKYPVIKQFNNLRSNRLKLKQQLIIPSVIYTVKKGDTLSHVMKKFKVSMDDIKKYNKLKKYIKIGDKIVIPSK